jgi:hypothetical protein
LRSAQLVSRVNKESRRRIDHGQQDSPVLHHHEPDPPHRQNFWVFDWTDES